MTPEFVALLRDWSLGIFGIALLLVASTSINIGSSKKCDCPCKRKLKTEE